MPSYKTKSMKDLENLKITIKNNRPIIIKEEKIDNIKSFEIEENKGIENEIEDSILEIKPDKKIYKDKQTFKKNSTYPKSGLINWR